LGKGMTPDCAGCADIRRGFRLFLGLPSLFDIGA
jgi:hypothetical protein